MCARARGGYETSTAERRTMVLPVCEPAVVVSAAGGYASFRNLLLASPSADTGDLGALAGDDEHCRRTCSVVPGCAAISRMPNSPRCLLHSTCMAGGSLPGDALSSLFACRDGAITMLATGVDCSVRPAWHRLSYRLPVEGEHLGVVAAESALECRRVCDMMPACNSFARVRAPRSSLGAPGARAGAGSGKGVMCHLKGRCAQPGTPETTLDDPKATTTQRAQLARLKGGRFISHYRWPCSNEVFWPLPGLRRSLPPTIPSGLVSLDCATPSPAGEPSTAVALAGAPATTPAFHIGAGFVFSGSDVPVDKVAGYCRRVRRARPDVTDIRWPDFYRHPRSELIQTLPDVARGRQKKWQGKDAHAFSDSGGGGTRLFDVAALEVAQRSFNSKELILLTSNADGLPLVINLVANLAQIGHKHALILADSPNTCGLLKDDSAPACLHSTVLRDTYPHALRIYVSNPVWILWLQRYLYFRRAMTLGLNPLLLDADVVLFHDVYPLFHGPLVNYTLISLCDASAGYASVNGGVWYAQRADPNGPVMHIFAEFERRVTATLEAAELARAGKGGGGGKGGGKGSGSGGKGSGAGVDSSSWPFLRGLQRGGGWRASPSIIRFDQTAGYRQGAPADTLVYDQTLMNNVLLSYVLGREASLYTHTHLDINKRGQAPGFWRIPNAEWPTPSGLGTYDTRYPPWYARRERMLRRGPIHERMLQAPPWLFSAESDARVPGINVLFASDGGMHAGFPTDGGPRVVPKDAKRFAPGRPAAALWGARPPPAALVHFVCAAWPGSGGRLIAMQLWGKWYHRDIARQLGRSADSVSVGEPTDGSDEAGGGATSGGAASGYAAGGGAAVPSPAFRAADIRTRVEGDSPNDQSSSPPPSTVVEAAVATREVTREQDIHSGAMGFDAHSWMRVCAIACALGRCSRGRQLTPLPISPCTDWILNAGWKSRPLQEWARGRGKVEVLGRLSNKIPPIPTTQPAGELVKALPASYSLLERVATAAAISQVHMPPQLAAAVLAARTSHPRALVAFRKPLAAADRREYQLYVHLLMSVAMVTGRVPVLPLALCATIGEWSDRSRCVYVMHDVEGRLYCVQRPPSICHGRVALPSALSGIPASDVAVATLPRLPLLNGSVDVRRLGEAVGRAERDRRVLLLDTSLISSADDVGNLLATPKGWLCTLEHKSCQNAC